MNMATLNESLKSFSKRKKPELQSQFPFLKEYQIMEKIKKQWNNKHGSSGSLHRGTIHKGGFVRSTRTKTSKLRIFHCKGRENNHPKSYHSNSDLTDSNTELPGSSLSTLDTKGHCKIKKNPSIPSTKEEVKNEVTIPLVTAYPQRGVLTRRMVKSAGLPPLEGNKRVDWVAIEGGSLQEKPAIIDWEDSCELTSSTALNIMLRKKEEKDIDRVSLYKDRNSNGEEICNNSCDDEHHCISEVQQTEHRPLQCIDEQSFVITKDQEEIIHPLIFDMFQPLTITPSSNYQYYNSTGTLPTDTRRVFRSSSKQTHSNFYTLFNNDTDIFM